MTLLALVAHRSPGHFFLEHPSNAFAMPQKIPLCFCTLLYLILLSSFLGPPQRPSLVRPTSLSPIQDTS